MLSPLKGVNGIPGRNILAKSKTWLIETIPMHKDLCMMDAQ